MESKGEEVPNVAKTHQTGIILVYKKKKKKKRSFEVFEISITSFHDTKNDLVKRAKHIPPCEKKKLTPKTGSQTPS